MDTNDYCCSADLMGRNVLMTMRLPGIWHEVRGKVIAVSGSVPGEWEAGVVQVLWEHQGDKRVFNFDMTQYCAEEVY